MGLLDLFIASSIPVLKVLLVTGVGTCIATDRMNILGDDARKHLNNMAFYVFTPSLIFSKLANTITYQSMVELWFMPINILITFIIGSILGWVVIQIARPPPHLRGLIIGCCAAGSANEILKIGAIYLWAYVYNILRVSYTRNSRSSGADDDESSLAMPQDISQNESLVSFSVRMKQRVEKLFETMNLKKLFAPSTTGAIVGFVVGLVPQIRNMLIGDTAPLRVVPDSVVLLGDGAIPAVTLIMGGNLLKGLKGTEIQKSIIFCIFLVRYVALPLIGIVVVKGAVRFGFVHDDPLYEFVLLLQFSLPPAMNIGTMTQLFGAGESECSVIMLWGYSLAFVALTLWSTVFLWLVS